MSRRGEHTPVELTTMLIDVAFEMIKSEGHVELSMRKLAAKIGYTVGTIYSLFKNQEELLLYVNGKSLDILYDYLVNALEDASKEEKLYRLAIAYLEFAKNNKHLWTMLFEYTFKQEIEIPTWYFKKIDQFEVLFAKTMNSIVPGPVVDQSKDLFMIFWASIHGIVGLFVKCKLERLSSSNVEVLLQKCVATFNANSCLYLTSNTN